MEKIAFLFPGQASQYVGMAKDLYDTYAIAKDYFNKAAGIVGYDLKEIAFSGPEEKLKQTSITQLAVFIHSCILYKLLKDKGVIPLIAAGHSLGEYSAVVCSGALSFEEGLKLVKIRGELMHAADERSPGTMAAILGLEKEKVEYICNEVSKSEVLIPANYNSPKQLVISGSIKGVEKGMELAREAGAKRVIQLAVGGAFHSPLMEYAREGLAEAIDNCNFGQPDFPVVSNVEAQPASDIETIKRNLKNQLLSPVRWEDSIRTIINQGVTRFLEVGPKKVLQGLMRQIDPSVEWAGVDTLDDIKNY